MSESDSRYYYDKYRDEHIESLEKENKLLKNHLSYLEDKFKEVLLETYHNECRMYPGQSQDKGLREHIERSSDTQLGIELIKYIKNNPDKEFIVKLKQYYTGVQRDGCMYYRGEMKLIEIDVIQHLFI